MFRPARYGVWSAIAAAAFAAALALAPSVAQAHAGHVHSHPTVAAQPSQPDTAAATQVPIVQELTAPRSVGNSSDDSTCDGRGCCASGPCTGCHGLVLTTVPGATPPSLSTLLAIGSALARAGPDTERLRRPPKIFV